MLTKKEREAAAKCAEKYPPHRSMVFFYDKDHFTTRLKQAADRMNNDPTCIEFGWPAIAVTAVRSQKKGIPANNQMIYDALTDLENAVPSYYTTLNSNPPEVASLLRSSEK